MTEYIDTTLVECDRVSAQTKNDDYALWTNNMNNSIQMNPGDKVSVYSSFVSEVGATQPNSVEFKAKSLGFTKNLKYTTETNTARTYTLPEAQIKDEIFPFTTDSQSFTEEIDVKDNEANVVINYYKTMDTLNYIQLPRRYIPDTADQTVFDTDDKKAWSVEDSITLGRVNREPYMTNNADQQDLIILSTDLIAGKQYEIINQGTSDFTLVGSSNNTAGTLFTATGQTAGTGTAYRLYSVDDVYGYVVDDYQPVYQNPPESTVATRAAWNLKIDRWILKNDNTRMTIMRKNKTYHYPKHYNYVPASATTRPTDFIVLPPQEVNNNLYVDNNQQYYIPPYFQGDPESFNYEIYREKIKLEINRGYSSSQFISDEANKKLQETRINKPLQIVKGINDEPSIIDGEINPQIAFPISCSAESNTYKLFPATNDVNFNESSYNNCLNNTLGTRATDPGGITQVWGELGTNAPTQISRGGVGYEKFNANKFVSSSWYESLEYIGMKRPEIYEMGSKMNTIYGLECDDGAYTRDRNRSIGFRINLSYNEANCKLIKDFINSQEKYPELFSQENIMNTYEDTGTETNNPYYSKVSVNEGYAGYQSQNETITMNATIQNSRWMHFNSQTPAINTYGLQRDPQFSAPSIPNTEDISILGSSYYDFQGVTTGYYSGGIFYPGLNDWNYSNEDGFVDVLNPANDLMPTANNGSFKQSVPWFFYYDPESRDTFVNSNNVSNENLTLQNITERKLTYGCIGRDSVSGNILLYPNLLSKSDGTGCGLSPSIWDRLSAANFALPLGWRLGFDRHWNAWGTAAIALTSGIPSTDRFYDSTSNRYENKKGQTGVGLEANPQPATQTGIPAFNTEDGQTSVNQYKDKVYLGAPTAKLGFDGSHFFFQDLHNILLEGDLANLSSGADSQSASVRPCYKINPVQQYNNYSPVQFPYQKPFTFDFVDNVSHPSDQKRTMLNKNLQPYSIFDTDSGIFIEDLGYTQESWEGSYWNRLGFTYEQFHPLIEGDRLKRHIEQPNTIKHITTNAKIDSVDTKGWAVNQFQNRIFDGSLSHTYNVNMDIKGSGGASVASIFRQLPQIINATESIKILAQNYPIRNFKGYYAIRSDIVPTTSFIGGAPGNTAMAIVGIIDKMQPAGDFYFGTEGTVNFTITKPTVISSISIAITDPNGSYAVVSERSSIIFRIDRKRILNTNIINEVQKVMEEKLKKIS
tara:strand:- start:75 stop:3704 length:3630 start_codon:yes stop_codon:yes gene_type:complete